MFFITSFRLLFFLVLISLFFIHGWLSGRKKTGFCTSKVDAVVTLQTKPAGADSRVMRTYQCQSCIVALFSWILILDARLLQSLHRLRGQWHANAIGRQYTPLAPYTNGRHFWLHLWKVSLVDLDVFCRIAAIRTTDVWEYNVALSWRHG